MPDAAPYTVIETPDFLASAKRHLTDDDGRSSSPMSLRIRLKAT